MSASPHSHVRHKDTEKAESKRSLDVSDGDEKVEIISSPAPEALQRPPSWAARAQFIAMCWTLFVAGWNDGTTGPLLPRMQTNYHVNYTVVSIIFIVNCVGFIAGAGANVYFSDRFGLGKTMVIGAAAQLIGYSLQAPAPPFPVFVLGYAVNGFGIALQDAGANGYVASLKDNAATKMGALHAVYGLGALIAPISATQFSQMKRWSFQYLVSIGISFLNTIVLIAVFRFRRQEECLAEIGQARTETTEANHEENKYRQIFRLREVHFLAVFILIYVGVEVTIGGWSVTYVQQVRGAGKSSGYVSTGFFAGLTFGRVALLWVNKKIGERRAVFVYTICALGLELIVWLVPSFVGGAIAVSFIGMFLGPIYPIVMNHSARILPHWLLTGSIGWIAGLGQAGSAFIPFITGAIAEKAGIKALQPVMVTMMGVMFIIWMLVPKTARRIE